MIYDKEEGDAAEIKSAYLINCVKESERERKRRGSLGSRPAVNIYTCVTHEEMLKCSLRLNSKGTKSSAALTSTYII